MIAIMEFQPKVKLSDYPVMKSKLALLGKIKVIYDWNIRTLLSLKLCNNEESFDLLVYFLVLI